MTSATNDAVFDLIQRAMLRLNEHTTKDGCDDIELAETFAALGKARSMIRPVALTPKPGYSTCPGTYTERAYTRVSPSVGICRHCHAEMRIVSYGKYLRQHYTADLPDLATLDARRV